MNNVTASIGPKSMTNTTMAMPNGTTAGGNLTQVMTTNDSDVKNDYDDDTIYLLNIGFPCLIPLGLIGNGLSFAVMVKMAEKSAFFIYMAALSLSDFMLLLFGMLPRWLQQSGFYPFFPTNVAFLCSIAFYPLAVFSQYSALVTAAATIERYVVIAYPLKADRYCSRKRAILYLSITFTVVAAINFPGVCFHWNEDYTQRLFPYITEYFCSEFLLLIDLFLYFIIPALVIMLFNSLIIRGLYSAAKRRLGLMNPIGNKRQTSGETEHNDITKQTIITLFLVTLTFIVTLIPLVIGILFSLVSNENPTFEEIPFLSVLIDLLSLLNHTVNFILYGLSGKMYRELFCKTVCFCRAST